VGEPFGDLPFATDGHLAPGRQRAHDGNRGIKRTPVPNTVINPASSSSKPTAGSRFSVMPLLAGQDARARVPQR
jgi:hypothetical protein